MSDLTIVWPLLLCYRICRCVLRGVVQDDGRCESHFSEEDACKATVSILGLPLCYWKPATAACHYMAPLTTAYWGEYQTTSSKWVGDRNYDRIAEQQELNEHRRFSAYFYAMLQNFHSITYILVLSWAVLVLARALTMSFERLFREKVYNSYLSWHKYAHYLNKKFGGEEEPTLVAKSFSCLHACCIKPCCNWFRYYFLDCSWMIEPSDKFDHKGRSRERKHHTHFSLPLEKIDDPSLPVPSIDNPEDNQQFLNYDFKRASTPAKGLSVGGVGWSRQMAQYQDVVEGQKAQKEMQDKQKSVINSIDQLRKPHVTLNLSPVKHEGPGIDGGKSSKTTVNRRGETSLHDHNNYSEETILENSGYNSRMQEERRGRKVAYNMNTNNGKGSAPGSPAGKPKTNRSLFASSSPSSSPQRSLKAQYHGGTKYHQQIILEHNIPTLPPTEKDYPFREGIVAGARAIMDSASEEMNALFGAMQEQYREFRESRPNSTQVYRNRYWNNGLSSTRPGVVDSSAGSPDVEKAAAHPDNEGPGSVPVRVFSSIQASVMSAVKASANTNDDYYTLTQEYEDLMMQARELVKRPRMSEEAATTVAYVKQMLGVNDEGDALNIATATNHRSNSVWCCCCVVAQCLGGYMGLGYGGLYYPSTTADPTSTSTHSLHTAPSKGSIMRNLQFSRIDSKRIFHRVYGLNNSMKNMFLLENFLLSEYPVTRYAAGNGIYLLGMDTIPPNVVSLLEYILWVFVTIGLLFLLPLYFVIYYISVMTFQTNINDIVVIAGTAYVLQNAVISPIFLYWFRVVVASALETELSHLHMNIRNRARTVFERKFGFFGRDLYHNSDVKGANHALTRTSKSARVNMHNICCVTDHYNPTCRVAKAYTGLVIFRLVLELNDYDINRRMHYILKRKHEVAEYDAGRVMLSKDGTRSGRNGGKSGKSTGSYLAWLKSAIGGMIPQRHLTLGDDDATATRVRRSVRKSYKRSAKIGVIPEGDEDAETKEGGDVELGQSMNQGKYPPIDAGIDQPGGGQLVLGAGDDIELGLGGDDERQERYEPEDGEDNGEDGVSAASNGLANASSSGMEAVLDAHMLYKNQPADPNANFDARSFKAVPSATNLRLQMGERSVVASFLDGSSVGVSGKTAGVSEPVHLAPWEAAYEAAAGALAVGREVCGEGLSRCHGHIPACCFSVLGAILAGLLFLFSLAVKGCTMVASCFADCVETLWIECLLRVLTTRSQQPCSRSGAYRCFQHCLNVVLSPIFSCFYYKSTYTHSLAVGEGNIEWESYYDRAQHAYALMLARFALTAFPVIGLSDVFLESLLTLVVFGFMALCWFVLSSDHEPVEGVAAEEEHWLAVECKAVLKPILLYVLPTIVILMVIRAEFRRRAFNFTNKNLAEPLSPYGNVYPRMVEYLSKLEDLQGNGAEALLTKRLLLEHADTDDILSSNHNRRLDGRRGGIVDDVHFNSNAQLGSKNFHGASMLTKDDLAHKVFDSSDLTTVKHPKHAAAVDGNDDEGGPATEPMDRSMRSNNNLLKPKGYSSADKDYLARKEGFFASMQVLSQHTDSSSDEGAPGGPSDDDDDDDGRVRTEDITKTHTLANSFQSSGLYGQSRRDMVDRVEAEARSPSTAGLGLVPTKGSKDPSGYFYVPREPKKKKKKLDQQEEDIQRYMSQLSLASKHTVKSYLKASSEAATTSSSRGGEESSDGGPAVTSEDGGHDGDSRSPKKQKKKKKREQQVKYRDY